MFNSVESIGEKLYRSGTHRAVSPSETLGRLKPLLPVMGVTRVANVTGLDHVGLPVVMVCRPNSRSLSVSQGKGLDLSSARASGLMESVEQFHAERITRSVKLASYNEIRFEHCVADPAQLPRVDIRAFHHDLRLLWIQSVDLVGGERFWLPYELVHLDLTSPLPPGSGCFPLGSNGLASGNHFLEAVCYGVCEVVERDAAALWLNSGGSVRRRTRLDLSTIDDRDCCNVIEVYREADIAVLVWDITSDLDIPAFYCEILGADSRSWRSVPIARGMGCHPSRGIALLRALTEAAQSRLTRISGARDDLSSRQRSTIDDQCLRWLSEAGSYSGGKDFRATVTWEGESFRDDIRWLLDRLVAGGFGRVLTVDLTHPGLRIPVVRIVIPGLEGYSEARGYIPGARLKRQLRALNLRVSL